MDSITAINVSNLSKKYRHSNKLALNKVSFKVKRGEVYGFLGANGAGKTTTIRTLLNFIQPSGGKATILGRDIVKDSVDIKRLVGYLSGDFAYYPSMTGNQFLKYMAQLQPPKHSDYLKGLVKRFNVDLAKPIENLSKGNRQKIGLLQALMHEPEILILDEPTSGLDPLVQEEFYALIKDYKADGVSVFVSSHNFAEVLRMCDRVGFIREGKLIAERQISELVDHAAHSFTLTFKDNVPLAELKRLRSASIKTIDAHRITITIRGELTPLFIILARHHVLRLEQPEANLEQEFLKYYEERRA